MNNLKLSGNAFTPKAGKIYESTNVLNVENKERAVSVAIGAFLCLVSGGGKKLKGLKRLARLGGAYLLYRGISGNCPAKAIVQKKSLIRHTSSVNIRTSVVVNAPRQMVYDAWRNLERLPHFLKHIKKIKVTDAIHSHWILKTGSKTPVVEWDAEIIDQQEGRELSWRSLKGSMIETAGKINFADTPNGTEIIIMISYRPPAGYIGEVVARLLNSTFRKIVESDVARFKDYIENKAYDESHYGKSYF